MKNLFIPIHLFSTPVGHNMLTNSNFPVFKNLTLMLCGTRNQPPIFSSCKRNTLVLLSPRLFPLCGTAESK
jgi:hypothetical protein